MATIPDPINTISSQIYAAYESEQEPPRPHMGASQLGHPCDRWLWLQFRHAVVEKFPGRMLLLFNRGHLEESRVVAHLHKIGARTFYTGANQLRFDFGSHVKGSCDGLVENLPIAPKTRAILEVKTHSDKSFKELQEKGVAAAKPMHWIQCCVYGYGANLDRALYFAVNKNTDEIYTEWLHLDKDIAEKALERGKRIALSDRMPEPLSTNPSWYQCKFCPAHSMCHKAEPTKQVNCRTCAWSTAKEDGTWRCEKHEADDIPVEFQRIGCDDHVLHMDLVPWKNIDNDNDTATFLIDSKPVKNGRISADTFSSSEILANPSMCANPDEFITALRVDMGGKIVS